MQELCLNGKWMLKEEALSRGTGQYGRVVNSCDGWLEAVVPGDVRMDLLRAGKISEPLIGLNSFDAEWIENRSWWYRRSFATNPAWFQADIVELELDGLDVMADIFLNHVHLGRHLSAFRPFCADIKDILNGREQNLLVVRVTSGLEHFSQKDIAELEPFVAQGRVNGRGDKRRVFVRKPQYSFGWDWNPRVPACGITAGARIRPLKAAVIRDVAVRAKLEAGRALMNMTVQVESLDWIGTQEGKVQVRVTDEHGGTLEAGREVFLCSGYNYVSFPVTLEAPRLWWPSGMGEQHLYTVEVAGNVGAHLISYPPFRYGLRTVELEQSKTSTGSLDGRLFRVRVNGVPTYCRGANWVPADSVYARVTREKYAHLVHEAKEANFNMLRIWGGGLYERDAFYEACDREGIMIWHDFMFACAAYPDSEEWFASEVRKEAEHQVTRLRNHASIVLWCGSNENTWGFADWWSRKTKGGARIYNQILPDVIRDKSPDTPYWNSSPYGGSSPNCAEVGDRHHWHDCMMNPDVEKRIAPEEYDKVDPRFISEYGYIGPCSKDSTLRYLAGHMDRTGEVWRHHTNPFEKNTVLAGIKKHYADPEGISDDDYLLYGGLCQGLMYEYSLDSFRSRLGCSGALFWMFNDSWGEVGWSIVDYFVNRKISFNFVRRANLPRRMIVRGIGDRIVVTVANDDRDAVQAVLEYGYMSFDGTIRDLDVVAVSVAPFTREVVHAFAKGNRDLSRGCLMARFQARADIPPAIFRSGDFRTLQVPVPDLAVCDFSPDTEGASFAVRSSVFAHAVHFGLPSQAKPSDEYFDLLPGEERTVRVTGFQLGEHMITPRSVLNLSALHEAGGFACEHVC